MKFVDLNKLTVAEKEDYKTIEITIDDIDPTMSAAKLGSLLKTRCGEILASNPQNYTHYRINLRGHYSEDDFTSLVLLTSMYFFSCLLDEGGRARERRLGIPAALSEVCISASSLKRAINTKTKVDIFKEVDITGHYIQLLAFFRIFFKFRNIFLVGISIAGTCHRINCRSSESRLCFIIFSDKIPQKEE